MESSFRDGDSLALLRESGGALLVEPESPSALADAMRLLRDQSELRAEFGRRARAFAELASTRRPL